MKVTVVTQAYNVEKYIDQCVKSVLGQTHTDLQYILIDNGSTDGSGDIMKKYADSDSRIKFIQFEQNGSGRWFNALNEFGEGEFFSVLDADDWLEPDCLERLVGLAESSGSDIVTTGSFMHAEGSGQSFTRNVPQKMILNKADFTNAFAYYHVFFRTAWGKLIRMRICKSTGTIDYKKIGISYGSDTLYAFAWLRHATRICIDNSVLHHYRIHQKSVSHKYDPRQSYSDLYLFKDAIDFLSPYGPISAQNLGFLYNVYSYAVLDTNANIKKSTLSPAEKMHEYRVILERDVTKNAYSSGSEPAQLSRADVISSVLNCAAELADDNDDLNAIKELYFPECGAAVYSESAKLFLTDNALFNSLVNDDRKSIVKYILSLIEKQKLVKQFELGEILRKLSQDNPVLSEISDVKFLKKYGEIYLLTWSKNYSDALDAMTDILLKEAVSSNTFLNLYLTIAAGLECADEFVFGKVKLAAYYCAQKRADDCRAILNDLTEMGVEDNDEISDIKHRLEAL